MENIFPAIIISVVTAITAYITIRCSLKQFFSQRWWEKKVEAYSNIIEHLSYLQYYFGEWFDEDEERLSKGYRHARESVKKLPLLVHI